MPAATRDQWAALTRAFLARFFENEITRRTDDLKSSFFWMAGILVGPGIYIPVMMSFRWSVVGLTQGSEALQIATRGDKAFYLGLAVVASAVVSVIAWGSLLPDRRDALILGALPVRAATVVASKLLALGAYIGLVTIAMHAIAAVFFGFGLATRGTVAFLVTGIVAHLVASSAATAFVLLAITAVQGIALAVAGARVFSRVSPLLQGALVAAMVSSLLSLPVINLSTVDTLAGIGADVRPWILSTPPLCSWESTRACWAPATFSC